LIHLKLNHLPYSSTPSVGLFAISLAKLLRTPSGKPYRVFATVSPKNNEKLLALGVEAVYDYLTPTWPEDLRKASGGISYAVDCISEDESTANISRAFVEAGGKIAVIRKAAWNKEGVRDRVVPLYGAAWSGLGHEIIYNNEILPASATWREFTKRFYKWLTDETAGEQKVFPIPPNPVRLMPGGLDNIAKDGFALLGSGKVADRANQQSDASWLKPISGEKLVYRISLATQ